MFPISRPLPIRSGLTARRPWISLKPGEITASNYYLSYINLADVNADGLADLVVSRLSDEPVEAPWLQVKGQLLINTGTTWKDLHGRTTGDSSPGPNPVPWVPTDGMFAHGDFVDLDGRVPHCRPSSDIR